MNIPPKSWYVIWGLIGFTAGAVIGATVAAAVTVARFKPGFDALTASVYASAINAVALDTKALTKLRNGENAESLGLLEEDLDGQLYWLASYESSVPAQMRTRGSYTVICRAASYRKAYSRPLTGGTQSSTVNAEIAKALALCRD